jgi:hypothetical protein
VNLTSGFFELLINYSNTQHACLKREHRYGWESTVPCRIFLKFLPVKGSKLAEVSSVSTARVRAYGAEDPAMRTDLSIPELRAIQQSVVRAYLNVIDAVDSENVGILLRMVLSVTVLFTKRFFLLCICASHRPAETICR